MTVYFSDLELEYINQMPFHWTIKDDCPKSMRKSIEKKLNYLYGKKYNQYKFENPRKEDR